MSVFASRPAFAVCLLVMAINATLALRDLALPRTPYMFQVVPNGSWLDGAIAAIATLLLITALLTTLKGAAKAWAKAALAFALIGPLLWLTIIEPAFWTAAGPDDCSVNCLGPIEWRARDDFTQGQIAVLITTIAALGCMAGAAMTHFRTRTA